MSRWPALIPPMIGRCRFCRFAEHVLVCVTVALFLGLVFRAVGFFTALGFRAKRNGGSASTTSVGMPSMLSGILSRGERRDVGFSGYLGYVGYIGYLSYFFFFGYDYFFSYCFLDDFLLYHLLDDCFYVTRGLNYGFFDGNGFLNHAGRNKGKDAIC